ncbi:superoxide dismutase [Mn], mitochondrial-like protein [Zopfochytrium polystomum]|nr:superoxide dismutase [Mn], mitochondrial-like protein [Zopfochytrium polystomum]
MLVRANNRFATSLTSASTASAVTPASRNAAFRRLKHTLPDLPYDFNALEPFISAEIMQLHHSKHHQAYVTNLNVAEEKLADAVAKNDNAAVLALKPALNFNFGGHVNHSIFWHNLAPQSCGGGDFSTGALQSAIKDKWGSLEAFTAAFNATAAGVQGSGWGWLVYDKNHKGIEIISTANQDPVLGAKVPLLGIDVWEHAYYLQYKNVRPDYLKAVWNVVNWNDVAKRYDAASKA